MAPLQHIPHKRIIKLIPLIVLNTCVCNKSNLLVSLQKIVVNHIKKPQMVDFTVVIVEFEVVSPKDIILPSKYYN